MGFWRTHYFISRRAFVSNAQTEVFDLPKVGVISNLMLKIEAAPGSANNDIYLADILSKVEVVGDGSTVIKSYDGRQIQAIMAYDDGVFPPDTEVPPGWAQGHFDVRFGRYPGDEKYALDCGAWKSLELKITYNLAAGGTLGTTGFTAASGFLQVFGYYAPVGGGLAPVGFIKSENKKTLTTAANTEETLDLPTDFPYRRLIPFCETHGYGVQQAFQYLTVDVNEGAKKPVDNWKGADMQQAQALRYKQAFAHFKRFIFNDAGVTQKHRPMAWTQCVSVTPTAGGDYAVLAPTQQDPNQSQWPQVTGVKTANVGQWGFCPWGSLLFDLEKDSGGKDGVEAMQSAWDCTEKDDITFKFTPSAASIAVSIVLEQYAAKR